MSDISRGEGWWQASDYKWYPPEQHPDVKARAEPAVPAPSPPVAATPPPAPVAPPSSNVTWIVAGVLAAAVVALGTVLFFGRDDDKKRTAAVSSSILSSHSSASSSSAIALTEAELRGRLFTAKDLGGTFTDDTFGPNPDATTLCGTPNPDRVVPPTIDVGSAAKTTTGISFQQEIASFGDAATASRAFDLDVAGFSCSHGTTADSNGASQSFTFQRPKDRSTDLGVENAAEIVFQSDGFHGQLFFVRTNATVVQFAFIELDSSDTSTVPEPSSVVQRALDRLAS